MIFGNSFGSSTLDMPPPETRDSSAGSSGPLDSSALRAREARGSKMPPRSACPEQPTSSGSKCRLQTIHSMSSGYNWTPSARREAEFFMISECCCGSESICQMLY